MDPKECAPGVHGEVCSRNDMVEKMRQFVSKETGKPCSGSPAEIVQKISKVLGCNTESCVLSDNKFVQYVGSEKVESEKEERFRPPGPRDSTALLNNFNIDGVLHQYTKAYPDFHHIGFRMIDFADTEPGEFSKKLGDGKPIEIAKSELLTFLNPKTHLLNNGKKCAGVVLNTDFHTGPGKHWFALFLDFRNPKNINLEYFNSSGNMPPEEIHEYLVKLKRKIFTEFPQSQCNIQTVSTIQIQDSKTECGVYSLYYIIKRVEGVSLEKFRNVIHTKGIPDEKMVEYRKNLFRAH